MSTSTMICTLILPILDEVNFRLFHPVPLKCAVISRLEASTVLDPREIPDP
jgi:hypothetical protein